MTDISIWWIRRDIRLQDNHALISAVENSDQLIPLFILEPQLMVDAAPKRRAFLLQALSDLDQQLQMLGTRLILRQGPARSAFEKLAGEFEICRVFAHEDYSPFSRQRDQAIAQILPLYLLRGITYHPPQEILKDDGNPYVVFTPYKNKWYSEPLPNPADCLPDPKVLPPLPADITSDGLPDFVPAGDFPATADEAQARLESFIGGKIRHYQSRRNFLAQDGTSQLSPYLRFGLLSAREVITQAQMAYIQANSTAARSEIRTWMNELVWREFYTAILYHFPHVLEGPFRPDYKNIPWRDAPDDLLAWQNGETGYPIVDACMRQLKHTGWMHNRGRMIAASFLTKDLLTNWQAGEDWFMKNLVDGDPAANNGGWQWSAGTGTDAAPYFRIFNPVTQGLKFDPDGDYIARWVPELQDLPPQYRHEPWKMSKEDAQGFGFTLGKQYPLPIVDHAFARQRTLAAYKSARGNP